VMLRGTWWLAASQFLRITLSARLTAECRSIDARMWSGAASQCSSLPSILECPQTGSPGVKAFVDWLSR